MVLPHSMIAQGAYLKQEAVPGTAETTGFQRFLGLRIRPGFNIERTRFRAEGYKTQTSTQKTSEMGQHTVEGIQDFNAITPIAASVLSYMGATQPDNVNAPNAWEHTFALDARAEDILTAFTLVYGDSTQALQAVFAVFNSLTFGVQRGSLTLDTSMISETPTTGATIPGGATEVPSVPIPATGYDAWLDNTWAGAGTTKLAALYQANVTIGDKRSGIAPIDSGVVSYNALPENEDTDYSVAMIAGFDATAVGLINDIDNNPDKVLRLGVQGPNIGGTVNYELELTVATTLESPGEVAPAPNGPVVSVPLNGLILPESVTGNTLELRVVNTVATF